MKLKPINRTTGRQLSTEIPEDRAPDEVVVDADNRLRRIPVGTLTKVRISSLWDRASADISGSLTDRAKDVEFMRGFSLACQIYGLRFGGDPMMPRAARPQKADQIPAVTRLVLDNASLLQDEIPTALHNMDLGRLDHDGGRLDYVRTARTELRLLDNTLEIVQAQIENRIAPVLDLIFARGRSVIETHAVLSSRLDGLREFCVGAAEDAAEKRKERDREFDRGVEAARSTQPAPAAPAPATPPVAAPAAPAAAPKIKRTAKKQ